MLSKAFKSIHSGIKNIVSNINPNEKRLRFTINQKDYIEDHLIAEGGYGFIYEVYSSDGKNKYAIKKINISDKKFFKQVKNEIILWSKISKNKHIVQLYEYEITEQSALILMELCTEGTLLNYIKKKQGIFPENEALNIIYQIASGLYSMHTHNPPITHRDIKIENILKFGKLYKLCDFGSATTFSFNPSKVDNRVKNENFAIFEKNSTIDYRPPEMCDEYSNYIVNEKVDIWALGCILYCVLFKAHPFQDAQKLTIISAQYIIPKEAENYSEKTIDLIRVMLTPNPSERPSAKEIIDILKNWNNGNDIELSNEVIQIKNKQLDRRNKVNVNVNVMQKDIGKIENKQSGKENEWNFVFGGTNKDNNNNNKKDNSNIPGNDENLFDFEFTDTPINKEKKNEGEVYEFVQEDKNKSEKQNNQNVNENFGWDLNFNNKQEENKSHIKNIKSFPIYQNKNDLYVFPIDNNYYSNYEPQLPKTSIKKNQTINAKIQKNTKTPNDQDILSFFT